jgi:hypothetical protein
MGMSPSEIVRSVFDVLIWIGIPVKFGAHGAVWANETRNTSHLVLFAKPK